MTTEQIVADFAYGELQAAYSKPYLTPYYYCLLSYLDAHDDENDY